MKKYVLYLLALLLPIMMTSCAINSSPDNITAADKLTSEELRLMVAHARIFIKDESRKFNLNNNDLEVIAGQKPRVRTFYTGHKTGRLSLGWTLTDKQFFAILEGDLMECKAWRIMLSKNTDVLYYNKAKGKPVERPALEEFEELRKK